jgi:hypothetical protein
LSVELSSNRHDRQWLWGLALGAGLLLIGGAYAAMREAPGFFSASWNERATLSALSTGMIEPAFSPQSQQSYFYACRIALTSISGRAQPSATRQNIAAQCLANADQVAAASPDLAIAWYTGALAASIAGDWPGMNQRLRQAYLTAPFEQWVAELRIDLAEDNYSHLDPDLEALHNTDLHLLLSQDTGRRFLAPRYYALAPLRSHIDALLPGMPEADSTRFHNMTQRLTVYRSRTNGR